MAAQGRRLRRSTVASAVALALAAAAFTVALIGATRGQNSGRDVSGRLVPAAVAVNELLSEFAAQQASLRAAVTTGRLSAVGSFDAQGAQLHQALTQVSELAGGDRPMAANLLATTAAYRDWLAHVADPQIADVRRGDLAAARAVPADFPPPGPAVLAVRAAGQRLRSGIAGEQQAVTSRLDRLYDTQLGALIALIAVIALIAAGVVLAVGRGLVRPLRELNRAVAAVADGSYGTRIPAVGQGELTDLSRDIERMRTRLVAAINERERAQQGVRGLFDLAPEAMVATAADGNIVMVNARLAEIYGYQPDELIGAPVKILVPEEWRSSLAAMTATFLAGLRLGTAASSEFTSAGLHRDGSTFPAEVRLSRLRTGQGTLIVAAVRDVSERLAMEAERERLRVAGEQERLQRPLQESRRLESLGQFVGGVARDFDHLLSVIAGHAELGAERLTLLAPGDDRLGPVLADVGTVATAAQQAIRVTRQLLTFSRAEIVCLELIDVNEVVDSAGPLLRRSLGEHIDLRVMAEPALWPVEAGHDQLEQVLLNVTLNARDAMPAGGRLAIETGNADVDAIYAAQRPGLEPGRYCRLAVSDTGTGMDAATLERVFEPFFSTKSRGRGTGLGLATVYGIVTGLGGVIDIYSAKGLGTTVSILLPVAEGIDAVVAEPEPAPLDQRGHGEGILLVEEDESLRTMVSRILADHGYQVRAAADGADAVRQAAHPGHRIDLLVTDMVLPGLLGIEVVARIRAARPRLPAFFISGYARQVLDFHGIRALDHDILLKPFTEAALLSRVRHTLDRSAATARSVPLSSSAVPPPRDGTSGDVIPPVARLTEYVRGMS